jgi:hypothetical protein
MNPYDWQRHIPQVEVLRDELDAVAEGLLQGSSFVVLGGRGMGKSVFLRQLTARLAGASDTRVVLFKAPPTRLSVEDCFAELARGLGVTAPQARHCEELFEAFFAQPGAPHRVVLLYDELDRYAPFEGARAADPPGRLFFNDLELARRELPGLGILAAGSIGIFLFRDLFGSSFLSRATRLRLRPLDRASLDVLTVPFAERRTSMAGALDAVHLATGGIPALATYALQELWTLAAPSERQVTRLFVAFRDAHEEYLGDLLDSFSDARLSEAPQRVLELIRQGGGEVDPRDLEEACRQGASPLRLKVLDVLHLLEATGLIRLLGSPSVDDPVLVRPVASFLNFPTGSGRATFQQRLATDQATLLEKLHVASADFFRPGKSGKQLVPESVFAAFLSLGLELLGWQSEREAQSAAGRTDLKLRRNGGAERAIVEVKIWGRNDYQHVQQQVESYATVGVAAAFVVQITDRELPDWEASYRKSCLVGLDAEEVTTEGSPIRCRFRVRSTSEDSLSVEVDHLLLRLSRRRE